MLKQVFLTIILAFPTFIWSQTQQGYVKTKGRLANNGSVVKGTRLSGATVTVKGRNAVISNSNGAFSLAIPGHNYYLQNVQKQGYVLTDPDALFRQYTYSKNPLVLVLEDKSELEAEKRSIERKIRNKLYSQLQEREAEIETLKEQNKISDAKYSELLKELNQSQDANERIVTDMTERYVAMDFDQLDDFNRRISDCIINGRLTEADSLLQTKGDINVRTTELRQLQEQNEKDEESLKKQKKALEKNKNLAQKKLEDIAQDCYSKFEIFKIQHQNDSAARYIELRASLAPKNVEWQSDAGSFLVTYMADYSKAMNIFQKTLEYVIAEYGEKNTDVIVLRNNIAEVYYEMNKFDQAIAIHQSVIATEKEIYGEEAPSISVSLINLGACFSALDKYELAQDYCIKALERKACSALDSARAYINLGGLLLDISKAQQSLPYYEKALDQLLRFQGSEEHPWIPTCYSGIAAAYSKMDEYDKALEYYKKALNLNRTIFEDNHPDVANAHSNLGSFYNDLGKYADAQECFLKALAIDTLVYGKWHPSTALCLNNLGFTYSRMGQYDKALQYYQRAFEIDKDYYGLKSSKVGTRLVNIGSVYENLKDYKKALECNTTALDIFKEILGEQHDKVATCYNNIGNVYFNMEEFDKAEAALKKALAIDIAVYGDNHTQTASAYNNLGRIYNKIGNYGKATEYVEKVLPILTKAYGEEHPNVAITYYNVGVLYKKKGDYAKALEQMEKAYSIITKMFPESHSTVKEIVNNINEVKRLQSK